MCIRDSYLLIAFTFQAGTAFTEILANPYVYALPSWAIFLTSFYTTGYSWVYIASLILLVLVFPVRLRPLRRFPRALPLLLCAVPVSYTHLDVYKRQTKDRRASERSTMSWRAGERGGR